MPPGPGAPLPTDDERLAPEAPAPPDLAAKVRFLRDPESYGLPGQVEAIETHMAWVFLVGAHAYKMKKPVLREMLDYRTLEDRLRICRDEVRLNRRLAPRVYLGIVPLNWSIGRGLSLEGAGVTVEWLVHMRRLPRERTLDRAAANGTLREEEVDGVARLLAEFYRSAPSVPFTPDEYRERFRRSVDDAARVLSSPAFGLATDRVSEAVDALQEFLTAAPTGLLDERARQGKIIEAHGDLRPEHIFVGPEPVVIDCLEFDRDLRLLDPADELSFLAVECSLLGQPWVGERFRHMYSEVTGDRPERPLLRFYEAFRAFLRAKIAIWHLADDGIHDHTRWRARALRYLEVARGALPRRGG
jgi:aminoglycoside phosphotransferase family enzyme